MTDTSIRRLNHVQLAGGGLFLLSLIIGLPVASFAPGWIANAIVIVMGTSGIAVIAAFFIQGGQKTREDRVESFRGKVAWGLWAARELEKMGVDPYAKG